MSDPLTARRGELPLLTGLAQRWHRRRTYGVRALPTLAELTELKNGAGHSVSVVLPALNESETIGGICATIRDRLMRGQRFVDELLVVDCSSTDGTPEIAEANGARVFNVGDLLPDIPVAAGKGDALWRSLSVVDGDLVVWIDSDIRNFTPQFVTRLIAPILMDPTVSFVKAFYRRPLALGDELVPDEGGRVTELLARPLLAALFPELRGFAQPLAGEYAGTVDVLRRVPFFTGYSVEIGLLIDLLEEIGLDGLAQVDLGERIHRNRPLAELAPMSYGIGRTILRRAEERGRLRSNIEILAAPFLRPTPDGLEESDVTELERPPIDALGDQEAVAAGS